MFLMIQLFHLLKATEPDRIFGDASVRVIDAAVEKAYKGSKKIVWKEVLAGEKAFQANRKLAT